MAQNDTRIDGHVQNDDSPKFVGLTIGLYRPNFGLKQSRDAGVAEVTLKSKMAAVWPEHTFKL